MSRYVINKITNFFAIKKGFEPEQDNYKVLQYAVSVFYYNFSKTVLLIIIAIVLKILPYVLFFALIYGTIRLFAFGLHLKNNTLCTITGLIYYLGGVYIALCVIIPLSACITIYALSFILNLIYAPSPTKNRPIGPKQKKRFKILTTLTLVLIFIPICAIGENVYTSIIVIASFVETLNILPITYKLFHEERG